MLALDLLVLAQIELVSFSSPSSFVRVEVGCLIGRRWEMMDWIRFAEGLSERGVDVLIGVSGAEMPGHLREASDVPKVSV